MSSVLLVEDEARIVSFLRRALTSCGYAVSAEREGRAALHDCEHQRFDLVLLDLLLPDLDGFSVLEHLHELRPEQEVVVLSALADVESKVRCFDLGAADYVTKPFVLAELIARVQTHLRKARLATEIRFLDRGELRLDVRKRIAIKDGTRVHLSTREFLLLEYLMRKDGDVCTREELLSSVWDMDFDPGTNVVDVCVRRLRRKLGRRAIETVRNVGYAAPEPTPRAQDGGGASAAYAPPA